MLRLSRSKLRWERCRWNALVGIIAQAFERLKESVHYKDIKTRLLLVSIIDALRIDNKMLKIRFQWSSYHISHFLTQRRDNTC